MSVKKTYWKGLSEKNQTPEFVEANSKEFQEDLPIDQFIGGEDVDQFKTPRRDFLKYMGFSVAAATLASCETMKDYWLFRQWTLLGTTILPKNDWIEVLNHANYTGDYYFTNAESLSLKEK